MEKIYYEPAFVRSLFDEMAGTYGIVNLVASFGFAARWRRQCLGGVALDSGCKVVDLMSGMGELCPALAQAIGPGGRLYALDFSAEMCRRARQTATRCRCLVEILETDALESGIPSGSVDVVVSSFGLKTLAAPQVCRLAREIARMLRPGGVFSLVEISVPPNRFLRWPYLFYLKRLIPIVGRLFLGNPDNYRMLGYYTEQFGTCAQMRQQCERAGLAVRERSLFYGCATGVVGSKPG